MAYVRKEINDDLCEANKRMLESGEASDVTFKLKYSVMGSSPSKPPPKPAAQPAPKPAVEPSPPVDVPPPQPPPEVESKPVADTVFEVDNKEETVAAHSYMISSQCPKLDQIVKSSPDSGNGKKIVELPGVSGSAFKQFLRYLYYRDVNVSKSDQFEVLRLARDYEVKKLEEICIKYIDLEITTRTVCEILRKSLDLGHDTLKKRCESFIQRNTRATLNDSSFLRADDRVVEIIARQDYLNVEEIELFRWCVRWAQAKSSSEKQETADIVGEELASAIGSTLIYLIRFPTMYVRDFNQYVVPAQILKPDEVIDIYNYITCPNPNKPKTAFIAIKRRQKGTDEYERQERQYRQESSKIKQREVESRPDNRRRDVRQSPDKTYQRDTKRVDKMATPEMIPPRDYRRMQSPDSVSTDVYQKVFFSW